MRNETGRTDFERRFIAARRAAIGLGFSHLNEPQREAVLTTKGPLLLLAGAGSGKTTALIERIANLLKYGCASDSEYVPDDATDDDLAFLESYDGSKGQDVGRMEELCAVDPVEPWRIIAITFTNKAAGEMKQRLARMQGSGYEDIWAMTFHSACARILRRDADRLGYSRDFTIYDTSDTASLMKRILKELDIDDKSFPHKTVLNQISRAKDDMDDGYSYYATAEKENNIRKKIIGRAFIEYESRMKSSNALDFDDLILLTVRLFKENRDVLQYYQKRFEYVLVDEYQDTNKLQYMLASLLAGGYGNICVVGDDDQSIYKFRGATIENILNFEMKFKDTRIIRLEQNYRSTSLILEAANDVIRNNLGRKGKKLWTDNAPGKAPQLRIATDERDEAQFIADTVLTSAAEGRKWQEHAVLYRMNAQSNQLETAFKRRGIPYRVFGGTGFYERAEIKDMLAYLCLIHNPDDDVRLTRVINNPPRGIGDTTVGRLAELAASSRISMFSAINESFKSESLKTAAARLHQFSDMIGMLRELAETAPLDELYETLIGTTGYVRVLKEKGTDEAQTRIENVYELKTNIIRFMKDNGGSLFDFLNETALYTDLDRDDKSTDRVLMMTMHSAKGLEFDTVFIAGAEEGLFPGARSIGNFDELEEERRLCYVAMTRAKRVLYFTSAQNRMLFGKTSSAEPSRFVGEISEDHIEKQGYSSGFGDYGFGGFDSDYGFGGFDSDYGAGFGSGNFSSRARGTAPFNSRSGATAPSGSTHGQFVRSKSQHSSPNTPRPAPVPVPDLTKGDTISHKAFGRGVVVNLIPAGGDVLLEIVFENAGTKKMLLNSAARYIDIIKE